MRRVAPLWSWRRGLEARLCGSGSVVCHSSRHGRRCGVGDDDKKIPEHHAAEVAVFFDANSRWLFGHACLRTSRDHELAANQELAADLVQDVFEAAARAWE